MIILRLFLLLFVIACTPTKTDPPATRFEYIHPPTYPLMDAFSITEPSSKMILIGRWLSLGDSVVFTRPHPNDLTTACNFKTKKCVHFYPTEQTPLTHLISSTPVHVQYLGGGTLLISTSFKVELHDPTIGG